MVLTLTSDTGGKHCESPIILLSTPTTFSALLASIQILSGPLFPTVSSQRRGRPLPGQVQSQILLTPQQKTTPSPFLQIFPTIQGWGEEIEDSKKLMRSQKNETEVIQVQCAKSEHNGGQSAVSSSPPAPWGQPHHVHPEPGIRC